MDDRNINGQPAVKNYPPLRGLLRDHGLTFKAAYTTADIARIFGVSQRTILYLIASGKLPARDLPGRARFLPQDLEEYLRNGAGTISPARTTTITTAVNEGASTLLPIAMLTLVLATLLGWRAFPDLDFISNNFRLLPIFLPFSQSFRPSPAGSDFLCIFSRSPQ
jgi:excisionase family DNA binding protein